MTYEEINQMVHENPERLCGGWRRGLSGKWINRAHVTREGAPNATGRQGSYILRDRDCVFDGADNTHESFIALYARLHGLPFHSGGWTTPEQHDDNRQAWRALAAAYGETLDIDENSEARWLETQRKLSRINEIYSASLKNRETPLDDEEKERVESVLEYFSGEMGDGGRGWTLEEVKAAGIGVLPKQTAEQERLDAELSVVIPIYADGQLIDLKFRAIAATTKGKYRNIGGTRLTSFAYVTANTDDKNGTAYICEGELDALRCQVALGLTCFAARGGANMADRSKLEELRTRGWKRIVFIADNDEAGLNYALTGVLMTERMGLSAGLVVFGGAKDADEFITTNRGKARELFSKPRAAFEVAKATAKKLLMNLGTIYKDFYDKIFNLYSIVPPHLRKGIEDAVTGADEALQAHFNAYAKDVIEELRAAATDEDKRREQEDARRAAEEAAELLTKATNAAKRGETNVAAELMKQANETLNKANEEEINLDEIFPSFETIINRPAPEGIPMDITLTDGSEWKLYRGALQFIGARTGHGKTRIMENFAIRTLKYLESEGIDESVLYFAIEEPDRSILSHLISIEADAILSPYENFLKIAKYAQTESDEERLDIIKEEIERGYGNSIEEGRIIAAKNESKQEDVLEIVKAVKYERLNAATDYIREAMDEDRLHIGNVSGIEQIIKICDVWSTRRKPIAVIFIDYLQRATTSTPAKEIRARIEAICTRLMEYKLQTHAAIVAGAQLNREVFSPVEMTESNLAEASFIEHTADDIYLGYLSDKTNPATKWGMDLDRAKFEELGFKYGMPGTQAWKRVKSRTAGSEAITVLKFEGATGRVTETEESRKKAAEARKTHVAHSTKTQEAPNTKKKNASLQISKEKNGGKHGIIRHSAEEGQENFKFDTEEWMNL